tara:strand:+ start:569 stop:1063 length:495 start_codon:yes stop_codon:yes gene_type:complete
MKQLQLLIDQLVDRIANGLLYILIFLIILVFSTVFFRYVFNISYVVLQELIMYLHALIFMFGISYALKEKSHVKIDIIYCVMNRKNQRVISIIGIVLFIIPTSLFITYISIDMVSQSWLMLEGSSEAGGLNLVYILKSLIPLTGVLILLQAISELTKYLEDNHS